MRGRSTAQQLRHDLATGPATHHNPLVQPQSVQTARALERPLVLIIDEEQSARDLYGDWFFAQGFQVMCAVGVAGLSLALRRERPQLIVTELKARDLTLHDLTARLRCEESTRCIPIIVLTASCDVAALHSAKAAGAWRCCRNWLISTSSARGCPRSANEPRQSACSKSNDFSRRTLLERRGPGAQVLRDNSSRCRFAPISVEATRTLGCGRGRGAVVAFGRR